MTTSQQDVQENQEIVSEWARSEKQDFDAMVSKYTDTSDAYWSSKKNESIALNQQAATTKNKQPQEEEIRQLEQDYREEHPQLYKYSVKIDTTAKGLLTLTIHVYSNDMGTVAKESVELYADVIKYAKARGYRVATEQGNGNGTS